jgi:hypothetical protein
MPQSINRDPSISQMLPGVSVSLNARPPATYDVVVVSAAVDEPSELYTGLRAIGFTVRGPAVQQAGSVRQHFGREGSAMHGGWTGPERERFIGDARRTLRRFGFVLVPEIPYVQGAPR